MRPRSLLSRLREKRLRIAFAESCTGGLAAAAVTSVAGSSDVFDRGFVTYSNEAKQQMLGVPKSLLKAHGAVSEQVAIAMAKGALKHSLADVAVSVTGIAGPGGATPGKPVGLVHFGCAMRGKKPVHARVMFGNLGRAKIRAEAVRFALDLLERVALSED